MSCVSTRIFVSQVGSRCTFYFGHKRRIEAALKFLQTAFFQKRKRKREWGRRTYAGYPWKYYPEINSKDSGRLRTMQRIRAIAIMFAIDMHMQCCIALI